jgi:hypothetical protein
MRLLVPLRTTAGPVPLLFCSATYANQAVFAQFMPLGVAPGTTGVVSGTTGEQGLEAEIAEVWRCGLRMANGTVVAVAISAGSFQSHERAKGFIA